MPEFPLPYVPRHESLQRSYLILKYAHDTAESLLKTFTDIRAARHALGAPTDEEQDLLRAMVVFAGAGIDSMMKQLIKDVLPVLATFSSEGRTRIARLGARHLGRGSDTADPLGDGLQVVDARRLARILLADDPRQGMMEILVDDLTAGSLQSASELFRILGYFGVPNAGIGVTETELTEVFRCRNQPIHEMDIDFNQPNRNRYPRRRRAMVSFAERLLKASSMILEKIDGQLPVPPAAVRRRPRR